MTGSIRTYVYQGTEPSRLDAFLTNCFAADSELNKWSRSQIKQLIHSGQIEVSGKEVLRPGASIREGANVVVKALPERSESLAAWDYKVPILFEDNDIIVINKPAGVSMHPGAGDKTETIVNALVSHFSAELTEGEKAVRAGIVHRLDKDTTGVVVIAKNVFAQSNLSEQFMHRSVKKTYVAFALSSPRSQRIINREDQGTIEAALGRHPSQRTKMAIDEEKGRAAITHWRVIERMHYGSFLEIDLATGRTHQIRVHFNSIGSPLIGDRTYGDFNGLPSVLKRCEQAFGRQALHAMRLEFAHPISGERLKFEAEIPQDFKALLDEFRNYTA